jgi:hypothetical protein
MAQNYSPKIVQDSLVMCVDPSQNKSYPTTDLPVKSGLVMWMDASDDTTFSYSSGTTVSQWRDKSPSGFHMVPKSAGPTRSTALNSRKTLTFTTSQTIGNNTINLASSANTVFVVSRYNNAAGSLNRVLTCNLDASGNNWLLGHWGGYVNQYYAEGWVRYQVNAADTTWRVYMGDYSGPSTDLANLYSNGTGVVTNSNAASAGPNKLGINYYSGEPSDCEVAEIVVFNRILTAVERRLINTYLGQKWGISNTDRSVIDLSNNDDNGLLGNGTIANMPVYDFYNKGFKFDGSNDYVSVGPNAILRGNNISLGVFFKTINNGQSVQFIAGYGDTGVQGYWLGVVGPIRFFVGNGSTSLQLNSGISPNNDQIYYVVGTYDGTNQRIYVDGVLIASSTSVNGSLSYTGMTDGFLLGQVQGFTGGRYLTGNIYHLQVYQKALSASEVAQNYEALKSRFANTIVQQGMLLNLDAGNSYSYAGAGSTWIDVSGNSYNATLVGSPSYTSNNNGGIIFDSNAKYGTLPTSGLAFGTGQFAIEVWVYSTAAVTNNVIYASQSSNVAGFVALFYPSGLGFALTDFNSVGVRTTTTHQTAVSQNTWYHVVGIRNASNQYIVYVNGVASTTNATATTSLTTAAPQIASNPATSLERFTGTIASLRLYNRSLSATEVLQNYNATKGRFGL